jgi:hypothetical protein
MGTARQRAAQAILNQIYTMSNKVWLINGSSCGLPGAGRARGSDCSKIAADRTTLSSASTSTGHREHR